jgi:hypothetical protein
MSSEFDTLHKILKDKTRRKIILLLNEKDHLSYTDLKSRLEVTNNGLLNFHLKALYDLLTKDEQGQYILTEKGKLASKLLSDSFEQDSALQAKKKWWKRFWFFAIVLNLAGFIWIFSLYHFNQIDFVEMGRGVVGFSVSMVFIFFFYKMIRPVTKTKVQSEHVRTIQEIFVSGRHLQEIKEEVQHWINEEGITIEVEREGFIRGRLGAPSGLGLSAPKYFEVTFKPDQNYVVVHTEGWISVFDVSEMSFSRTAFAIGGIPRSKGWKIMEHLWQRLKALSR